MKCVVNFGVIVRNSLACLASHPLLLCELAEKLGTYMYVDKRECWETVVVESFPCCLSRKFHFLQIVHWFVASLFVSCFAMLCLCRVVI
jgi:hypothetical protein